MTTRKSRPWRGGLDNPWTLDRDKSNRQPAARRPETLDQTRRWDVQKSRALAHGLCDRCSASYAWGLQIGFAHSNPPCDRCAAIVAATTGVTRPNGWRNMRLKNVATGDTAQAPYAHRSRNTTPEKYLHGYGLCGGCGASWTGYTVCHCCSCHLSFTSESAFVAHRHRGRCRDPQTRGLIKVRRAHWVGWGHSPSETG
jgi:hypothetical protein